MTPVQAALLIVCPRAEEAVGRLRREHDSAALRGIPAHVTVDFPFAPLPDLAADDEARLEELFAQFPPFTMRGSGTDWFGEQVLFVTLDDPAPVIAMTDAVTAAFPQFPPYGGVFDEVTPHLTVGHDQPKEVLDRVEEEVLAKLPFEQHVDTVELWSGPSTQGPIQKASWRRVRSYPLRGPGAGPPSRRTP